MKIQCESCQATYNIDESKIPDKGATAKCKKCGSRILIRKPAPIEVKTKTCPKCGSPVSEDATDCMMCGLVLAKYKAPAVVQRDMVAQEKPFTMSYSPDPEVYEASAQVVNNQIDLKMILGLAGAAVLFIGVFVPLVSVPIVGSVNYIQNGRGDGWIIIALAAVTVFLSLKRNYKGLLATGIGALAVMATSFILFQIKFSQYKSKMEADLAGNPFRGIADAMMQSIQFQWGWAVLTIGAALIISASMLKTE